VRAKIGEKAISVWLKADIELLLNRVGRRAEGRPLLAGKDARATLEKLVAERYPVYAGADIVVDSARESPEVTLQRVLAALKAHLAVPPQQAVAP
jgi:shikimate kinase